jgi:Rod binding domain-containing protein
MQDISTTTKSHLDFAGLSDLKVRAKQDQAGSAHEVGRQFEAMFVNMVFKSVREANVPMKSELMSSSSLDTFEQMYHQELSQVMAQKGLFGLGDWLAEQVNMQNHGTKAIKAYDQTLSLGHQDSFKTEASVVPLTSGGQ